MCRSLRQVTRDRLMVEYDKKYPEYHFADNKGYGAAVHIEALRKHGASPIHRKSFIKNIMDDQKLQSYTDGPKD